MTPTITAAANGWIVTTADGVQHVATTEMVVSAATAKASEYEVCQATQGAVDDEEVPGEVAAWHAWERRVVERRSWEEQVRRFPRDAADFRVALRIAIAANKSEPRRISREDMFRICEKSSVGERLAAPVLRAAGHVVEWPRGEWQ